MSESTLPAAKSALGVGGLHTLDEMAMRRGQRTTTGFFQELYAVVVGLGLALAVEQVIDLSRSGVPVELEHVPVFVGYLNLAFALAHASVRYLDLAYVDQRLGALGKARVIGDLGLGVGHFLWLIVLSFLITRPVAFAYVAVLLLVGRPARDALLALGGRDRLDFDRKVAISHLLTIAVLGAGLLVSYLAGEDSETWIMRSTILGASLIFGLSQYIFAFSAFFPFAEESDTAHSGDH
jgi:hypothetical protein